MMFPKSSLRFQDVSAPQQSVDSVNVTASQEKVQDPSSLFAVGSKLSAKGSVQPSIVVNGTQKAALSINPKLALCMVARTTPFSSTREKVPADVQPLPDSPSP